MGTFLGNSNYKKEMTGCEVADGTYEIALAKIPQVTTINDKNCVIFEFKINAESWNRVNYRHSIFEGDFFDNNFSRICDCFGVTDYNLAQTQLLSGDVTQFKSIGKASFSHSIRKQVSTGFNPDGTQKMEWKTEHTDFVKIQKFFKKEVQQQQNQIINTITQQLPVEDIKTITKKAKSQQSQPIDLNNFPDEVPF